jgi:hypothetical protein
MERYNLKMKVISKSIFILLASGMMAGCAELYDTGLYAESAPIDNTPSIKNVYALNIFNDFLGDENWHSEFSQCLQVENKPEFAKSGGGGLRLWWDRQGEGCDWTGMGFGWSGWAPKDLSQIVNDAAISFYAKSDKGDVKGLPWALALEDYAGAQAYAGVFPACIQGGVITDKWTEVIVPLSSFNYKENDFDQSIVKQMLIQFESAGEIIIDEIRLIPYEEGRKRYVDIPEVASSLIVIDGEKSINEWDSNEGLKVKDDQVLLSYSSEYLFVFATIQDDSPMQNSKNDADIWNGDCIEIAIATNADSDPTRKFLLFSDQHFGIKIAKQKQVWNWKTQKEISGTSVEINSTASGYAVEARIPWAELGGQPASNREYSFEVAIDRGDQSGARQVQDRWNSRFQEGFHTNPSLWGTASLTTDKE